jgi:membrane fusion protein (multidrug efflux system)
MKKNKVFSLKISLIVIMAVLMLNCSEKQVVIMPPQKVNVVNVVQQDIVNNVEFVGEVSGFKDIEIRARVDGFLEGIHFDEGFQVKKGQLLYTIDSQPFQAEASSFKSKLAESKTAYAKAQGDLNRYKPLAESNAVSQADLDAAQAQFDAAAASVQAAEANLELAQIKLGYTRIYSPINGVIGKTQAKVGEYVGSSFSTIVLNTVSKIDVLLVDFFLPENQYLQLVKALQNTDLMFDRNSKAEENLELLLGDGSIHEHKGAVNFIDRGIDPSTGTILIQTRFNNPKRILRPGQFAKVRIPIDKKDAIIIPQKCVIELQGQYSVFVVNKENKVESRQIVSGNKSGDYWVIEDGLEAGEKIIIDGIQKVRNGSEVEATEIEFKSQTKSN